MSERYCNKHGKYSDGWLEGGCPECRREGRERETAADEREREREEAEREREAAREEGEREREERAAEEADLRVYLINNPGDYDCPYCLYRTLRAGARRCPTCHHDIEASDWDELRKKLRVELERAKAESVRADQEWKLHQETRQREEQRQVAAARVRSWIIALIAVLVVILIVVAVVAKVQHKAYLYRTYGDDVDRTCRAAQQDIAANHFTNASACLHRALLLIPDHPTAKGLLDQLANKCIAAGRSALSAEDFRLADDLFEQALTLPGAEGEARRHRSLYTKHVVRATESWSTDIPLPNNGCFRVYSKDAFEITTDGKNAVSVRPGQDIEKVITVPLSRYERTSENCRVSLRVRLLESERADIVVFVSGLHQGYILEPLSHKFATGHLTCDPACR